MTEELKDKLLDILIHFKTGLDDIEEGSGERQPMQDEIDFALPLVKKLIIDNVSGSCSHCPMNEKPDVVCKHCGSEDIKFDHYFGDRCLDCGKHPTRD